MAEPSPLFVTSPARAGGTLLAHMLNCHSQIALTSDVYFPLFRQFRNSAIARTASTDARDWDPASPIQDYYFADRYIRLMDCIQSSDLRLPVSDREINTVRQQVMDRASHENRDLAPYLSRLDGRTYHELIDCGNHLMAAARTKERLRWVGCKDVWTIEFFRSLARAFPTARFIVLMRDPRAVIASMLGIAAHDPLQVAHPLSYARHWRKYAAFCTHYQSQSIFAGRLLVANYEDLVRQPDQQARRLCRWLDVPYEPTMMDVGQPDSTRQTPAWTGNSSFQDQIHGVSTSSVDRWRTVLPQDVVDLVQLVCGPDMKLLGYEPESARSADVGAGILAYLLENQEAPVSWRSDFGDIQLDYGYELFRRALLTLNINTTDEQLIRRSFLFREVFEAIRRQESWKSAA